MSTGRAHSTSHSTVTRRCTVGSPEAAPRGVSSTERQSQSGSANDISGRYVMRNVCSGHSVSVPPNSCGCALAWCEKKGPGEGLVQEREERIPVGSYSTRALRHCGPQQAGSHCRAVTRSTLSSSILPLNSWQWLRLEFDCWHVLCYLL